MNFNIEEDNFQKVVIYKNDRRICYLCNPDDFSDWTQESAKQFITMKLEANRLWAERYYLPLEETLAEKVPIDNSLSL